MLRSIGEWISGRCWGIIEECEININKHETEKTRKTGYCECFKTSEERNGKSLDPKILWCCRIEWLCCQSCLSPSESAKSIHLHKDWMILGRIDMRLFVTTIWCNVICSDVISLQCYRPGQQVLLVNWGNLAMGSAAERLPKAWGQSVLVEPRTSTLWSKRLRSESAAMPKVTSICLDMFLFSILIQDSGCFLHCRSELIFQLTLAFPPHQTLGWYQERKRQWGISRHRRFHRIS